MYLRMIEKKKPDINAASFVWIYVEKCRDRKLW
jgi:hypothetical protein